MSASLHVQPLGNANRGSWLQSMRQPQHHILTHVLCMHAVASCATQAGVQCASTASSHCRRAADRCIYSRASAWDAHAPGRLARSCTREMYTISIVITVLVLMRLLKLRAQCMHAVGVSFGMGTIHQLGLTVPIQDHTNLP